MREIEVKAKISDLNQVSSKLTALGCVFSDPIEQHDIIFVDDSYGQFDQPQLKKNLIRIREVQGKHLFTLKQPQLDQLDSLEHETEIANAQEMEQALRLMGYNQTVIVNKSRQTAKLKDLTICLDLVEGLGNFIEVEKLVNDDADGIAILKELNAFLTELGISDTDRVTEGYDTLMYRQQHS